MSATGQTPLAEAGQAVDLIRTRVLNRMSGQLSDFQILRYRDGVVLRGRARSYYVRQMAEQAVAEGTGLRVLLNDIEVC